MLSRARAHCIAKSIGAAAAAATRTTTTGALQEARSSLKSHAALVVTASVHEHHAAEVAIVPAIVATSERVLPEQEPRSLHSPIVSAAVEAAALTTSGKREKKKGLGFSLLPSKVPPVPLIDIT